MLSCCLRRRLRSLRKRKEDPELDTAPTGNARLVLVEGVAEGVVKALPRRHRFPGVPLLKEPTLIRAHVTAVDPAMGRGVAHSEAICGLRGLRYPLFYGATAQQDPPTILP